MTRILSLFAISGYVAILITTAVAHSAVVVSDDFSYPDGSLVPNGGWANHSGTLGDLLVQSGQAVVQHGLPSEDASVAFADQTTGVLTASFDLIVNDDTAIGGNDFEYFAHFFTEGQFNFRSRVDVVASNDVNFDYSLGISHSGEAETILTNNFNYGDTIPVVLGFDIDSGTGFLTVNSETILGTSTALAERINRFALRQSDSSNNETIFIDNLIIDASAVPEPSSIALLGMLGCVAGLRRRRS